jgi:hypothetical protein
MLSGVGLASKEGVTMEVSSAPSIVGSLWSSSRVLVTRFLSVVDGWRIRLLIELRSIEWQLWAAIVLSACVMGVLEFNIPFWYGGSDHADYINYANYILGRVPITMLPQWRTPGVGLFHIVSGTVLLDTWYGFKALFALFGAAIPVLTYLIVRPNSPTFALVAAVITIVSMVGYIYAFQPLSDHLFYFFHALVLCLCAAYFYRRFDSGYGLPVAIGISAAYLNMVRPVGAITFWLFIATAVIALPRRGRSLVVACGVYMAIMAGWVIWDRDYGANLGAMPSNFYPLPSDFSTTTERRLAEAYFAPRGLAFVATDASANGHPRSSELRNRLRQYLVDHSENWKAHTFLTPKSLFAQFDGAPDELLNALFADPNSLYFAFIVKATQDALGRPAGLALLHAVAEEHGTTGLYGAITSFFSDPTRLFLGAMPNFSGRFFLASFYREPRNFSALVGAIPEPLLTPETGPATTKLLRTMRRFISDYPQYCKDLLYLKAPIEDCYQVLVHGGRVNNELDPMINGNMDMLTYGGLSWYLGLAPAGRVYKDSAFEVIKRYPPIVLIFYDSFMHKTFVRSWPGNDPVYWRSDTINPSNLTQVRTGLTPGLASELQELRTNDVWETAAMLHYLFYFMGPLFTFILIMAFPFFPRRRAAVATCCFLLLVYLQEAVAISILSYSQSLRYEGTFYLLPMVITCIILGEAIADWRKRRMQSRVSAAGAVGISQPSIDNDKVV